MAEQYINIPLSAIKRHEHSLYTRLNKTDVEAIMEDLGKHIGVKTIESYPDTSINDVPNVLWQTGWGRIPFIDNSTVQIAPAEHEIDKDNPCHLTLGYLEGVLQGLLKRPVNLRRVRCMSDGEAYCEYSIDIAERRITQSKYAPGTTYRITDEQRAFQEFKQAVEEGRKGLAVTPYTEDQIQGAWDIPGIECRQVSESGDIGPWALGTLETVWHNFIKQNPECAILFTAVEYLRTQVEDSSISSIARKLGEKVKDSYAVRLSIFQKVFAGGTHLQKCFSQNSRLPSPARLKM